VAQQAQLVLDSLGDW